MDVVGSTAYKQRWISAEVNESWIVFFRSFFDEFHVRFCSEIAEVSKSRVLSKTGCPVPWKLLGDEILYAIKIDKGHEVFLYTEAFRKAVMNHRDKIEQSGKPVSLKATAWLAFPLVIQSCQRPWERILSDRSLISDSDFPNFHHENAWFYLLIWLGI